MRSRSAAFTFALIRTALETLPGWKKWLEQLNTAADSLLPLHPDIRNALTHSCWDSLPLALTLSRAAQGFPSHPNWDISNSDFIQKMHKEQKGDPQKAAEFAFLSAGGLGHFLQFSGGLFWGSSWSFSGVQHSNLDKVPVQKLVYKELVQGQFNAPIENIFCKRPTEAFQPYEVDFHNTILLQNCFCCLKKSGCAVAIKVLKGWRNGWATSRRYQEKIKLPCLFGCCKEKGELFHYLHYLHLFALWFFLCGDVNSNPLLRWGLVHPSHDGMLQIACAFAGYHARRRNFKQKGEEFMQYQEIVIGPQIRASWTVFA